MSLAINVKGIGKEVVELGNVPLAYCIDPANAEPSRSIDKTNEDVPELGVTYVNVLEKSIDTGAPVALIANPMPTELGENSAVETPVPAPPLNDTT